MVLHKVPVVVSKPAPEFDGTAVVNGEFKEVKLSDFKGQTTPTCTHAYKF